MNSIILFRSNNDVEKDNYKILSVLILFLIFKIFAKGIYSFIIGDGNLYLIFKPILFYIIYCLIGYFCLKFFKNDKKIDSCFLISSLIISYILPSNTHVCLFIIAIIIGDIINAITNNRVNLVVISSLIIFCYLSINNVLYIETYNGIFNVIYIILWLISFIYLYFNKLIKTRVVLVSLIIIIIINIISNNYIFDNSLFCLLFILSDNRYTPVTKCGQGYIGIIFGILLFIFKCILEIDYYLFLIILFCELLSPFIDYLILLLYNNKIIRKKEVI